MTLRHSPGPRYLKEEHSLVAVDHWDPELVWSAVDWTVSAVQLARLSAHLASGSVGRLVTPKKEINGELTTSRQKNVYTLRL